MLAFSTSCAVQPPRVASRSHRGRARSGGGGGPVGRVRALAPTARKSSPVGGWCGTAACSLGRTPRGRRALGGSLVTRGDVVNRVVALKAREDDDDSFDLDGDGDDDDDFDFGDIDRLAADEMAKKAVVENKAGGVAGDGEDGDGGEEEPRVWDIMNPGDSDVKEHGLSGRPLYVCQSIWWLRLSQLKTYAPVDEEVRDIARRSGLSVARVDQWFADMLDEYDNMSLADRASYNIECEAKLAKLEQLTQKLVEENPDAFIGRDDDAVNMTAPWNEDGKLTYEEAEMATFNDPLFINMTKLPKVMAAEAKAAREEKEVEEGLDDDAIARIPQDGSKEMPYLINPYTGSKSGAWSVLKPMGPPDDFDTQTGWIDGGGWDALPDHEVVSAVDGGALRFVGVNNDQMLPAEMWKLDRPHNRDSLVVGEEIDTTTIVREAVRHIGDQSRVKLHHLEIGQELEGTIVALELYHGALVDCGCETDGLITISENDWPAVSQALDIGTKVRVKVSAVHQKYWRFRFPIELTVLEPAVGHLIKEHPHQTPPINIYRGETEQYANWDAGRSMERFVKKSMPEQKTDEVMLEDNDDPIKSPGERRERMKLEGMAGLLDDEDEDSPSGAGATLRNSFSAALDSRTADEIAADEEEEAALFGGPSAKEQMAMRRENPDVVEEGDDEDIQVDTAADDKLAMNLNPEAEDTRGGIAGIINGVDDFEPAPGDLDDEDEDDDFDDDFDDDDGPVKSAPR